MTTTFKDELQKIFGYDEILSDTKYVGRACFGSLGKDTRMKAEFITTTTSGNYDALRMHILNRRDGEIDALTIRFNETWGTKTVSNGSYRRTIEPHLWQNDGNLAWYSYEPTYSDIEKLATEVKEYADVFREPIFDETMEMEEELDEGMTMM